MDKRMERQKKYLLVWTLCCLLATMAGIAYPVTQARSQGLEGANQANLVSRTEELTAGRVLEFSVEPPTDTAGQIGFFFSSGGHTFADGYVRIMAYDGETLIGGQDYPLEGMEETEFLSVDLDSSPEILRVYITSDARGAGPSLWFNENTATPGESWLDGARQEKSLVYNLTYTVQIHRIWQPLAIGILLALGGLGVCAAGGFVFQRKEIEKKKQKSAGGRRLTRPDRRQAAGLVCMVLLGALLFYYLYDTRIRIAQNTTEQVTVLAADGELIPVTETTARISQEVKPGQDQLTGLGVRFFLEDGVVLDGGSMHASVTDLTLGQVLCETDIQASQFISGEYVGLLFENSQTGAADHEYRIDLSFSEELWDSGLQLMSSEDGICVRAYLYFNIFLKRFFFFMFLGVEAFLCVFWYLAFVKKARLETVFLITVLFFGLIYNVMLTPYMVPDEEKHIDMAYRYSNDLLGYESLGDTVCLKRADDAEMEFTSSPSFRNYYNIYYGMFSGVSDAAMVEAEVNSNIEGSVLLYLPAVAGMSLARVLGWGTVPMLLLARYLNLLVFALLAWAGMKKLPFGKLTLFLLAVLPVNLQQCTSFSHDAMVHGIVFFYSCLCIQAIFSEEKMTGQQILLMELSALFLVYCKSGSYFPLALLPVLIPAVRYRGKREKVMALAALLGIPAVGFLMKNLNTVTGIVTTTASTSVVETGGGTEYLTGYTLGYFLKDPLELIYMIANTVFDKIGFYLESLVGYQLGWVEIETSMLIVLLFWFLLFLSTCDTAGTVSRLRAGQRAFMLLLCAGSTGLILLGMLLQWTPMGHVSIEGVQGRYFLPFMPVLLTACRNGAVQLKRRLDREIVSAAVAGQLLTLMYMIKQVTMV